MREWRQLRLTARILTPIAGAYSLHIDGLLMSVHRGVKHSQLSKASPLSRITRMPELCHPSRWIKWLRIDGFTIPLCTAMEHDGSADTGHVVKRKDAIDIESLDRRVTSGSGPGANRLRSIALTVSPEVWWEMVGVRREIMKLARGITAIGSMRAHGYGRVGGWTCDQIDSFSLQDDNGRVRRHLPVEACEQYGRADVGAVEPPYWHPAMMTQRVPAGTEAVLCQPLRNNEYWR